MAEHAVQPEAYAELPELNDDMLRRGVVKKGGRPRAVHAKRLISIRLTEDVIERWRSSGPGWQTRMADAPSRSAPKCSSRRHRPAPAPAADRRRTAARDSAPTRDAMRRR